ncbi:hypothetical protein [Virgibacillus phasianinus]|nr:hypothetical protein [Virgibacillus phasianinus]
MVKWNSSDLTFIDQTSDISAELRKYRPNSRYIIQIPNITAKLRI